MYLYGCAALLYVQKTKVHFDLPNYIYEIFTLKISAKE